MKSIFLVVLAETLHFSALSQIRLIANGNVGVGAITNPQSLFELEDH